MKRASAVRVDTTSRAIERLSRLSVFEPAFYLEANPDVAQAGADPLVHAATHGIREGRPVLSDRAMARAYGQGATARADHQGPSCSRLGRARASVFVHSLSDDAYRDLAASLVLDLASVGFEVVQRDEKADHRAEHGISLFVAPHEFFTLGRGPLWRDPELLGKGFVVLDDPFGSPVCLRSLAAVLEAKGVIETATVGAGVWTEAGIPTFRLETHAGLRSTWLDPSDLDHPLLLAAPEEASSWDYAPLEARPRPLDLLFFDENTPHRSAALGRLAPRLSRHRCYIYCQQPLSIKAEEYLHRTGHWRISGHLSGFSYLTLNLTADWLPCFQKRRVVDQAMAGGSVVISDVRFAEPSLKAGFHYLTEDARHLGDLIDWLLLDPEGKQVVERTRMRAFDRLATRNLRTRTRDGLRDFLLTQACEQDLIR